MARIDRHHRAFVRKRSMRGPVAIFVIALFMDRYTVEGALTVVGAMGVGISVFFMFAFQQVRRLE